MPEVLYLDTETYSSIPLKDGVHKYSEAVEVMIVAYALDDGPVNVWDVTSGEPMPEALSQALADESVVVWAHNVAFDRTVLKASLGIDIALGRWRCSMCLAYMHSMPGSLDSLCAALEVAQDKRKLKSGKDLVRLFCIPPTEASGRKRATRHTHPEKWQEFLEYAGGDIVAMRECIAKLPKWNLNASELALWQLDRIINERGIAVDLDFCRAAVQAADAEKARLAERASEMTDGAVHAATQRDALLAHLLKAYNVSLPDMQAGTIERRLEDPELPEPVKELLSIRLQASGTSVSKYKAFLRATSSDGRLRGTLQFGGASRTNRWAGRLVQLQNLSRVPKYLKNQYDFAVETIKCGAVELVYENAMDVIGSTVRGALVAAPGKKLCRADLSNIEGRVLAWLAGEDWKLKAFANGDDLYIEGYSRSFGIPVEEVRADEEAGGTMRLIGKVQELACIAAGEFVLTDCGLVPIESVTTDMRVWDGVEWVRHQGVICRGIKEVITYDGLTATQDHIVWTQDSAWPVRFGLAAARGSHLVESGADRAPIRVGGDHVAYQALHARVELLLRACGVHRMRDGEMVLAVKSGATEVNGLSSMRAPQAHGAVLALPPVASSERPLHESKQPRLAALRGAWNRIQVWLNKRGVRVRRDKAGLAESRYGDRPERQQRALRARQHQMGDWAAEQTQHETVQVPCVEPKRVALREEPRVASARGGHDARADHRGRMESGCGEAQELARHPRQALVYDIVNAGPRNRFTVSGKLVHNCGFQGAVGAFGSMAKLYGVNLEEDRVLEIVRAWRSANPKIVALWYDLEDAAINAVNNAGTTYTCGRLKLRRDGQWLRIRLPSGRVLCYPSPRWEPKKIVDADTGKTVDNPNGGLSYVGLNQYSRRWERLRTYGGRLAENCTQATARDVFAEGLKRCEANGYPVVMHVHDEAICETPDTDEYSGEAVARFLATPPDWAEGLPLAAEGSETKRYRK